MTQSQDQDGLVGRDTRPVSEQQSRLGWRWTETGKVIAIFDVNSCRAFTHPSSPSPSLPSTPTSIEATSKYRHQCMIAHPIWGKVGGASQIFFLPRRRGTHMCGTLHGAHIHHGRNWIHLTSIWYGDPLLQLPSRRRLYAVSRAATPPTLPAPSRLLLLLLLLSTVWEACAASTAAIYTRSQRLMPSW